MKPVKNTILMFICPKHTVCRNGHMFSAGRPCGHNLPHLRMGTMCDGPLCGVEKGTVCVLIKEVPNETC